MQPIKAILRRLKRRPERRVTDLSEIQPLSEDERRSIPEADFVSEKFDRATSTPPSRMMVILSTPRSGSTYLCQLLHRAGLCTPHEYFQREQYLPLLAHRWACVDEGRVNWQRFAAALERHRTSEQGLLAINLHGAHLHRFVETLPHFSATEVRYIWLRRQDQLRQAVSLAIASQTRQWSSEFRMEADPQYRAGYFIYQLKAIHHQEDCIRSFLALNRISCDLLFYEDLVADPSGVLRRLFAVEIPASPDAADRVLQRQSNAINDEFVQRLAADLFPRLS